METNWNKYWFKFIINKIDNDWDWYELSQNSFTTWEIVNQNPDKPWHWLGLSCNPNITMEIVQQNPDKPWDWKWLSENPNFTMEMVQQNPDKPWNWRGLSSNKFAKEKEMFELRVRHQRFIQDNLFEEFVKTYMHPNRIQKLLNMGYSIDELDDLL